MIKQCFCRSLRYSILDAVSRASNYICDPVLSLILWRRHPAPLHYSATWSRIGCVPQVWSRSVHDMLPVDTLKPLIIVDFPVRFSHFS